ncbi:MAG: HlyD family type I secretion periplasmic adaptor subunit [Rhodospirillaceae bacterium]
MTPSADTPDGPKASEQTPAQQAASQEGHDAAQEQTPDQATQPQTERLKAPEAPALAPMPKVVSASRIGIFFAVVFLIGGLIWSAFAPLSSAALVLGQIIVQGDDLSVDHLEGGIVQEILVSKGDPVERDQILVVLEDTQSEAEQRKVQGQLNFLWAEQARLVAERDGLSEMVIPMELLDQSEDPTVLDIIDGQVDLFGKLQKSFDDQIRTYEERIAQLEGKVSSLQEQAGALDRQLSLISEELEIAQGLFEKGHYQVQILKETQRNEARLQGQRADISGQIAETLATISQVTTEIAALSSERISTAARDEREIRTMIVTLQEDLRKARDTQTRRWIRAPADGVINEMMVNTVGGVVEPGGTVAVLIPSDAPKLIEGRLEPTDIDVVRPGLPAEVTLSALSRRQYPPVHGVVSHVAANAKTDEQSRLSFYDLQVEINAGELERIGAPALTPGMPVEVTILAEERTLLDYILDPFLSSLNRAFRES